MISEVPSIAKNWWLFVVLGVASLAAGIAMIAWPGLTLLALGLLAGAYLIVTALMEVIDAVTGDATSRALSAIIGVIALIAGVICIRRPGESLLAIVIVLGVYLIAEGVIRIMLAFTAAGRRWWSVALGALDVIVGVLIMAWPGIGLVTLAVFFAVTMIVRGIFAIVAGFKLRGMRDVEAAPTGHTASLA